MTNLHRSLVRAQLAVACALQSVGQPGERRERGDVPGWVLITLMTAGLVAVLWAVAEDQLTTMFSDALNSARR
jgi:hypothetical protein